MHANFKLLKVSGGVCHFARVCVVGEARPSGVEVVEELGLHVSHDAGKVNRLSEPDWIDAAVTGIKQCGAALVAMDHVQGCHVRLTGVVGSTVDTMAEDVECAAFLATWQAFAPTLSLPEYAYQYGAWRITPNVER